MMHGTWQVTGRGGSWSAVRLGAGAVLATAFLSWLATVLWLLAIIGAILLVIIAAIVVGLVMVLRRPKGEAEALARQCGALRADLAPKVIAAAAAPPVVVHYHGGTHLHIEPGADPDIIRVVAGELPREKEIY
jgi:hypothetical protein